MELEIALCATGLVAAAGLVWWRLRLAAHKALIRYVPERKRKVRYPCGHKGPATVHFSIFGKRLEAVASKLGHDRERCPKCTVEDLRERIMRCSACGRPIFPGEPVVTYHDADGEPLYDGPYTQEFREDHVGCLDWDCCPEGTYFTGHWDGERVVPVFKEGHTLLYAIENPPQLKGRDSVPALPECDELPALSDGSES
ncbi:hypothetical protein ACFL26_00470 [Patescibacteria group bacterium]